MSSGNLALDRQLARWYPLKDHPVQLALMSAVPGGLRFPLVPAGRRCLAAGTLVATPTGPKPIESLQVGDEVIGFEDDGLRITTVTETHRNGQQDAVSLVSAGREYVAATENHKLLACSENRIGDYQRERVGGLTRRHRVRRLYALDLIGNTGKSVPTAYALGAMLGNGCCRESRATTGEFQRTLAISAETEAVPAKIATMLGGAYRRKHAGNYTWSIDLKRGEAIDAISFYREWCAGRYSHEKIADWSEIDTWDRHSALDFLAGVIDTDGSIFYKNDGQREAVVNITMQSQSVVDCCERIVFKFFQERLSVAIDDRDKYVNGPVFSAKTTSNLLVKRILDAIGDRLVERGRGVDPSRLVVRNTLPDRIGLSQAGRRRVETFDITVANSTNLYCLHYGGIVTSNSGKTERFKRFLVKQAAAVPGAYFAAAPTHDQAKKIFWQDLKDFSLSATHPRKPSESDRIIYLPNGSEIHVIGLDKPQRIEGIPWKGGGIDEFADVKPGAWEENILPALNTVNPLDPDYRAWCWLLGVPDGLNHYYDLCVRAEAGADPNFQVFHWKSAEILPPDVIEAMRRAMGVKQFKQEFEASFETASGRIYEEYGPANYTGEAIQPHERIVWMHDQNYTPLSSAVGVIREDRLLLLDEIVLTSAVSRQAALEFVERYKGHQNKQVRIYGDPAGRAGEKHGHASDYTEIEDVLRAHGWSFSRCVKPAHPSIKNRQNAVRAMICTADGTRRLFVNPKTAPWCDKGLATVQLQEGSTFQEDQTNKYQHITTAIGYCVDYEWPIEQAVATAAVRFSM